MMKVNATMAANKAELEQAKHDLAEAIFLIDKALAHPEDLKVVERDVWGAMDNAACGWNLLANVNLKMCGTGPIPFKAKPMNALTIMQGDAVERMD